jgi:hypothetical protein
MLMLLGLTAVLFAADPFVGTWKLNAAKSKYKTGAPLKDQTLTIVAEGNDLHITLKGTSAAGQPVTSDYTVPASGGTGKIVTSYYDGITAKIINANERETTFTKGGKSVYTARSKVNGKTLTITAKGTNAAGQPVEGTAVYDAQ